MRMGTTMLIGVAALTAVGAATMSTGRTGRRVRRKMSRAVRSAGCVMRSIGEMIE